MFEFRSAAQTPRVEERANQLHLVGYAAVFYDGTPATEYQLPLRDKSLPPIFERVMPGAFKQTIETRADVVAAYHHKIDEIYGRVSNSTLTLREDEIGLYYDCSLNAEDSNARSLAAKVSRGDVRGSSFGFYEPAPGEDVFRRDGERVIRELVSLRTRDVGPTPIPAYVGTTTDVSLRSLDAFRSTELRHKTIADLKLNWMRRRAHSWIASRK